MKPILTILAIGILGAWTVAAQNSVSTQAGASAQTQTSAQAGKSGAKASDSGSTSTSASAIAGANSVTFSSGTKIDATLAKSLDAKTNKPGDRVEARTEQDVKQNGNVVLKKGTTLVGHVTQAQARTKDQTQSQLGIVFDHAVLKNGQEMPLNATIQALAAAKSSAAADAISDSSLTSGIATTEAPGTEHRDETLFSGPTSAVDATTNGVLNTAASTTGRASATANAAARSTGTVGGLTSEGRLDSNSNGVFGLQGLSITSAASNATQGTMIVSPTKNVHLDSGTQMLLSVPGQAQ